jgi:hypothetical protein
VLILFIRFVVYVYPLIHNMASSNEGSANNIDWDEVIKKEARGIDDADFGEVQLIMGDTVITEKGIADKDRFTCQKALQINLIDITCALE